MWVVGLSRQKALDQLTRWGLTQSDAQAMLDDAIAKLETDQYPVLERRFKVTGIAGKPKFSVIPRADDQTFGVALEA